MARTSVYNKDYYLKNKEAIKSQQKEYRLNNKDKIKIKNENYKNTEAGKAALLRTKKKSRDELSDFYVKSVITTKARRLGYEIKRSDVTPEMIEIQRKAIILNRIKKSYIS